jgi:hypothetical protein
LIWFQLDQPTKHVQDIKQLRSVLGEPMIGLNVAQSRRLTAVANNRTFPIALSELSLSFLSVSQDGSGKRHSHLATRVFRKIKILADTPPSWLASLAGKGLERKTFCVLLCRAPLEMS